MAEALGLTGSVSCLVKNKKKYQQSADRYERSGLRFVFCVKIIKTGKSFLLYMVIQKKLLILKDLIIVCLLECVVN